MRITETRLPGAFLVEPQPIEDHRGLFARTVCRETFGRYGLSADFVQSSISQNRRRHTLRGMHFQQHPHAEDKLVRCTAGAVFDVIVDLRPESPTRYQWLGVELSAGNRHALYIPKGFAHGFMTVTDDVELLYQMTTPHVASAAAGVRWNDPLLAIAWPAGNPILSERDAAYPDIEPAGGSRDRFPP